MIGGDGGPAIAMGRTPDTPDGLLLWARTSGTQVGTLGASVEGLAVRPSRPLGTEADFSAASGDFAVGRYGKVLALGREGSRQVVALGAAGTQSLHVFKQLSPAANYVPGRVARVPTGVAAAIVDGHGTELMWAAGKKLRFHRIAAAADSVGLASSTSGTVFVVWTRNREVYGRWCSQRACRETIRLGPTRGSRRLSVAVSGPSAYVAWLSESVDEGQTTSGARVYLAKAAQSKRLGLRQLDTYDDRGKQYVAGPGVELLQGASRVPIVVWTGSMAQTHVIRASSVQADTSAVLSAPGQDSTLEATASTGDETSAVAWTSSTPGGSQATVYAALKPATATSFGPASQLSQNGGAIGNARPGVPSVALGIAQNGVATAAWISPTPGQQEIVVTHS